MSGQKLTDKVAFETLIRSGRRTNRLSWTLSGDRQDVEDLNAAIRKASGRGEREPDDKPYPWKSIGNDGHDDEGT
jgi:hypothetical protein